MPNPNDIKRWLDNGWYVLMWGNDIGLYSAALVRREDITNKPPNEGAFDIEESRIADDFEPTKALARLAEKPLGN